MPRAGSAHGPLQRAARVLVPVDGSAGATAALRELVRIARWFRDAPDIHLVAVYEGTPLDVEIAAMPSAEALRRHPQQQFDAARRTAHEALAGTEFTAIAHTAVGPPEAWSSIGSRNPQAHARHCQRDDVNGLPASEAEPRLGRSESGTCVHRASVSCRRVVASGHWARR